MASCLQRLIPVIPRLRSGVGVGVVPLDAFGAVDRSTARPLLGCSLHLAGLPGRRRQRRQGPDSTVANSNGSRTLSDQVVSPNSGEQPRDNPPDIRRWARETGTPWAYEDVSIRSSSRRRTLVQGFKALGAEPLQVLVRFRADFADVVCRRGAAPLPGRNRAYSGGFRVRKPFAVLRVRHAVSQVGGHVPTARRHGRHRPRCHRGRQDRRASRSRPGARGTSRASRAGATAAWLPPLPTARARNE